MNILSYAPQMAAYGGMERHICDLAAILAGRGHQVTLLTTSNSLGAELREQLASAGVKMRELHRQRGKAGALRKGLWLAREALRSEGTRWDLIYTNGQSGLARVAWLPAKPHTRIVHHHHTAADRQEQNTWSAGFRQVLRRAPEIVACSRSTQEALERALHRKDIRFLPYLTRSPVHASAVKDRLPAEGGPLNFGFMGRLVAEKGIDVICRLSQVPELADIAWHIHGAGPKYPAEFFRDYPHVAYHGPFNGADQQAAILQKLDALVLFSSHNEGMPLSLIEAMSAGLPLLASARGGTRELAISTENVVVVDDLKLSTLAPAVRDLAERIRSGRTSRTVQRRAYDQHFSPAVVGPKWTEYFEQQQAALVQ